MPQEFFLSHFKNDPNLVSYWRFEGNSNDFKGTNNGSDTSITYSIANGKFGQGAGFSQPSSSKISLGTPASLVFTGDFSFNVWVKPASSQPDAYARIFDHGHTLMLVTDGGANNNGWTWENVSTTNGGTNTVDYDTWQMVTVVRSGTTVSIYKNAVLLGTATKAGTLGSGNFYFCSQSGTGRFFTGALDEAMFFNDALTLAEIKYIYAGSAAGHLYNMI